MAEIFLEIFSLTDVCQAPIETVIALLTIKYCNSPLEITLVRSEKKSNVREYVIKINNLKYNVLDNCDIPYDVKSCELPNLMYNSSSIIAGLCACLRQIVKLSSMENININSDYRNLLGFKESCLLAPAEASVWTKYCEVDLISTLKYLSDDDIDNLTELPVNIVRFEVHMSQPVRIHNIHKYTMSKKFANQVKHDDNFILEHVYAEGSFMTLADIIIFICIYIFVNLVSKESVFKLLPLTAKWYERMSSDQLIKCLNLIELQSTPSNRNYSLPIVSDYSLYKSDKKRYKPRSRIYTRQDDIENSLALVKNMEIDIKINRSADDKDADDDGVYGVNNEVNIDWDKIPYEATPEGGSLPQTRLTRKFQQLENLSKPVIKFSRPGDVIVDFCSGSGHLGILIAYLLPKCTVILLENKEESLNRSRERVDKLNLKNIKFYQCNLDYFKGDFDIGTSLHACGVATDLVIQHCLRSKAIFVSCPCCYGSIQDCHHITYPRSSIFKDSINVRDYLIVGHAADQTHDDKNAKTQQGYECMKVIDTDRKLQAEEFNYNVYLMKLQPDTCTPKNHLLIGIPKFKFIK
ncbi:glutathione S-transferase C-terminal domain-containing protein homolog [Microplitis demolitor]|uniref:glutathione S-transferase C-terminal domain-containing protein homolog n=1 Tax=Microplitis demolitor TaxID=69319 RepID=UPI0004CD23E3|nr:glutathione S-transferase C-terminal domain-containing protein homolog [Microplitis demolitor]